jgi:hypothetical protein
VQAYRLVGADVTRILENHFGVDLFGTGQALAKREN